MTEKVLEYPRDRVKQDTYYNCGPASVQTIVRAATGGLISEGILASELGTHTGGTDYIGQFPRVLNRNIPGASYRHKDVAAYPDAGQKEQMWRDMKHSIDAGHGVVVNIEAPPSNYPRAVMPSTVSPSYGGGTVYHYIAVMGYAEDPRGRRVWVADSGFYPYGYWLAFDQLTTLVVPKGYAYSTTAVSKPAVNQPEGVLGMSRKVPSRIVDEKSFDPEDAVANVDMYVFYLDKLMVAVCEKLGIDAEKIKAEAKQREIDKFKAAQAKKEGNK